MILQNYEEKTKVIQTAFQKRKQNSPEKLQERLKFSWSNWGFGREPFRQSCERLARAEIRYIELHGNHYGKDLGYRVKDIMPIMRDNGIQVSGVCGMFSAEFDMSSNNPIHRQSALDYLKREISFTAEVGGEYLLVVPAAVGRPKAYDACEKERSIETLQMVADLFTEYGVKAAIEPIRSAETSIVHTFEDAKSYIQAVGHSGVQHINGDVYHMQVEESHIGEAIVAAGERLVNLHLADSNRCALGTGSLDLDCIIMALYLLDYNNRNCFVTPEPLGPGGDPYPAMHGNPSPEKLDQLVFDSVSYFRTREQELLKPEKL